jgi:hypothetical protein
LLGISTNAQETRRRDAFGNLFELRAPSLWRGENGRIDAREHLNLTLLANDRLHPGPGATFY